MNTVHWTVISILKILDTVHTLHVSNFAQFVVSTHWTPCTCLQKVWQHFAQSVTGVLLVAQPNTLNTRHTFHRVHENFVQSVVTLCANMCRVWEQVCCWWAGSSQTLWTQGTLFTVVVGQAAAKQAFPRLCQAPAHYSPPKVTTSALTTKIHKIYKKSQNGQIYTRYTKID